MFTVSQKQTIEQVLTQCKVTFDSITFSSNHKVTIKQAIAPSAAMQVGCFRQLKPIAWRISDAIGAGEEVDYFATGNTAIFTLKVDLARAQRQATPRPKKEKPVVAKPKAVVIEPEPTVILTAQGFQETAAFAKGEVVWVAVMFQGKAVRIKAEVVKVDGDTVTVISNRTHLVYHVKANLVFAEKPAVEVLALV